MYIYTHTYIHTYIHHHTSYIHISPIGLWDTEIILTTSIRFLLKSLEILLCFPNFYLVNLPFFPPKTRSSAPCICCCSRCCNWRRCGRRDGRPRRRWNASAPWRRETSLWTKIGFYNGYIMVIVTVKLDGYHITGCYYRSTMVICWELYG